jgi:hypothetical protein
MHRRCAGPAARGIVASFQPGASSTSKLASAAYAIAAHRPHLGLHVRDHARRKALPPEFPLAAERPVLRDVAALFRHGGRVVPTDSDDAIQTEAPALAVSHGAGVALLEPVGNVPRARRNIAEHLRWPRRSPRGPPIRHV